MILARQGGFGTSYPQAALAWDAAYGRDLVQVKHEVARTRANATPAADVDLEVVHVACLRFVEAGHQHQAKKRNRNGQWERWDRAFSISGFPRFSTGILDQFGTDKGMAFTYTSFHLRTSELEGKALK